MLGSADRTQYHYGVNPVMHSQGETLVNSEFRSTSLNISKPYDNISDRCLKLSPEKIVSNRRPVFSQEASPTVQTDR